MPEPALRHEGEVEEDRSDDAAGYEEGFETLSANVGYVGYALIRGHGGVVGVAFKFPDYEHCEEHACIQLATGVEALGKKIWGLRRRTQPCECADEGKDPGEAVFEGARDGHVEDVRRLSVSGSNWAKYRV